MLLGVDTGGTFTDFVLQDGDTLRVHKVLSTPEAPEQAILQGIAELGLNPAGLRLVHGSTVATNAVLEGQGVRTAFITNRGLGDLLTIGRQARRSLYDLQPAPPLPPVPASLCLETGGRLGADGSVVEPLEAQDLEDLKAALQALRPEAVAISLLFSFLDARFEQAIEAVVPEGIFVSRSSAVLPEYREYERGIATWLNAWVGPKVGGYLQRLCERLSPAPVSVMQSSAHTIDADYAARHAVRLLLSGPAAGLLGARHVGAAAGCARLLTFDMGGTSTDVALVDGAIELTSEGRIGDYPVAVPMVDLHTIGAGGGSIATVDAGGLLQVGPRSAGAQPGPACYGRGGTRPTVTDANLILGRLLPDAFLGGEMELDGAAARAAMAGLASRLGLSIEEAAEGIVRLADEHMVNALRVMSVQRGIDPREFTLVCFGGAGGLHVCALAEALGMEQALVPMHGGVLSALGMLVATPGRELSRTLRGELGRLPEADIEQTLAELRSQGIAALQAEGQRETDLQAWYSADLRYLGQSFTLNLPWSGSAGTAAAFHAAHQARYGHALDQAVELVNLRARVSAAAPDLTLRCPPSRAAQSRRTVALHGVHQAATVFARDTLAPGQRLAGPALITETVATTYVAPGWQAEVHASGSIRLQR